METLIANSSTVIGGVVVAGGMVLLEMYRKRSNGKADKCSGVHCNDHQKVFEHIIESKNDIKWIKEKLDN